MDHGVTAFIAPASGVLPVTGAEALRGHGPLRPGADPPLLVSSPRERGFSLDDALVAPGKMIATRV